MTYKHWINKNYDRLVSEYEDYFDSIDKEIDVPMSLDEFGANGKWKKDANQPKDEIYEPNYESCKL